MLTAQIGIIDPNDYYSSARSGGKDGLGIISTHPEINRSLGVVPNDLDLSKHRCYLPVHHGWISTPGKTYWDGNLGETQVESRTDALTEQLIKTERTKMWLSVMSTVASLAVAAAIFTSLRYK